MTSRSRYEDWLQQKSALAAESGFYARSIADHLYPFQRDLVRWALRRGRAAIFAECGLGKTAIQLEWARQVLCDGRVLILCPLGVAAQTVTEAQRFGVPAQYSRFDDGEADIVVTNYEMLHRFDPSDFAGVVLDESSILKSYEGKTRTAIIEAFRNTRYRLACTATPAPNDFTELGNHSEFLGVRSRTEMLAEFFLHDGGSVQDWRLKGHAAGPFWRWVSMWGAVVRSPADLGHDASAFELPELRVHEHVIPVSHREAWSDGYLFAPQAKGLAEARAMRRATIDKRIAKAVELTAGDEPAIVWCELNIESERATKAIDGAIEVRGSHSIDEKQSRLNGFSSGRYRVMVSKPSIAGLGLNWQHCSRMIFLGASYSYESTYQAIRRCWRFRQGKPVDVHILRAETEENVIANYRRKDAAAHAMFDEMAVLTRTAVTGESIESRDRWVRYEAEKRVEVPEWLR